MVRASQSEPLNPFVRHATSCPTFKVRTRSNGLLLAPQCISVGYCRQTVKQLAITLACMLGDVLRQARIDAGFTQEKLSFEAHVDRTYISELENDHKSPTLDVLFRICDALHVPASEIIARVEKLKRTVNQG